jgi:predicted naringenin-chalcone synthase
MTIADQETIASPAHDRSPVAVLRGIGTAAPPALLQSDAATMAEGLACESDKQRSFLQRVFSRSGVTTRGSVLVDAVADGSTDRYARLLSFYRRRSNPDDAGPTTAARMALYADYAPPLAERAAREALDASHISPGAITHLITVSCTGFFAPGLDVALIERLGLPLDVRRAHLGFMGCHGAFNALGAARAIVRGDERAVVLVCTVELSSLHFAYGFDPGKLVANALFADGAAAVVVTAQNDESTVPPHFGSAAAQKWIIRDTASYLVPQSHDAMTWRIGDNGFLMTLAPELPALVKNNVRPWLHRWLARHDLTVAEIGQWAVHPGGPKILEAVAEALDVNADDLRPSYDVLATHGNMSSATILFVLQQLERAAKKTGPCVAIGMGPGLMMEAMLLDGSG